MRLTVAVFVLFVAILTGNALLIVVAVIGATALMVAGSAQWAHFRTWLHTPAAGHAPFGGRTPVRALPPDDDPDFLRWLAERNHRQQHGDDSGS